MRFSAKYQPTTLDEIVGQPAIVRSLKTLCIEPYPACIMLKGPGGVGKSATAKALIADLGVSEYSVNEYAGPGLKIEDVGHLFNYTYRLRPMFGDWHVLLIEEFESAASKQVNTALKSYLSEQNMPPRLILIATSNDTDGLDGALLQRFDDFMFPFSSGSAFADGCRDRLRWVWEQEVGPNEPFPIAVVVAGWRDGHFSMRLALSALGTAVTATRQEGVAA